jgi:hypothetical protein
VNNARIAPGLDIRSNGYNLAPSWEPVGPIESAGPRFWTDRFRWPIKTSDESGPS